MWQLTVCVKGGDLLSKQMSERAVEVQVTGLGTREGEGHTDLARPPKG